MSYITHFWDTSFLSALLFVSSPSTYQFRGPPLVGCHQVLIYYIFTSNIFKMSLPSADWGRVMSWWHAAYWHTKCLNASIAAMTSLCVCTAFRLKCAYHKVTWPTTVTYGTNPRKYKSPMTMKSTYFRGLTFTVLLKTFHWWLKSVSVPIKLALLELKSS